METRSNHRVRFKTFELDLSSRELRRNSVRLKLQGQPLEVLAMLLERPGEVVTREEMRRRLWSGDAFVDFEHSLNSAVRRLREALGDNAEDPRFVETLPRLGYRFIASVQTEAHAAAKTPSPLNGQGVLAAELPTDIGHNSHHVPVSAPSPSVASRTRSYIRLLGLAAAVIAVLAIALLVTWWRIPPAVPVVESIVQLTDDGLPKGVIATDGARIYFNEFDIRSGVTSLPSHK